MKKIGYILLAFILFILIGCGSSSGFHTELSDFKVYRYVDGNVSRAEIKENVEWNSVDYYAKNASLTMTLGNFHADVVCKEKEYDDIPWLKAPPTFTFKSGESGKGYIEVNVTREANSPDVCTDIKFVRLYADENITITVNGTTLTKQKKWVKMIENPNYGKLSLEDIYATPESNETNKSGVYPYDKKLTGSKIVVVLFEKEFPNTTYVGNVNSPYFSNIDFRETNMSIGDWVLVKDTNLSFKVVDVNSTDLNVIAIDPNINKNRLENGNSYDVISTLDECTYTFKDNKIGYYCPNEENRSKIFVVEYNATEAIYRPLSMLVQ